MSITHIPFYPSDWLGGTRTLTAAETGVYITLICQMYEMAGPIERNEERLTRFCGCRTKQTFVKILDYLIEEGKVTEINGELYNDKVEKTIKNVTLKSSVAKQAAQRRWDKKPKENNTPKVETHMRTHKKRICQTDANQSQSQRDTKVSLSKRESLFDLFWNNCPKKTAKGSARKAFEKAIQKAEPELIIYSMQKYKEERAGQEKRYTAHPATWLNAERWDDEETTEINIYDHIEGITNGTETRSIDENSIDNTESIKQLAPMGDTAASETRGSDRTDPPSGGRYQREVSSILRQGKYKR